MDWLWWAWALYFCLCIECLCWMADDEWFGEDDDDWEE